VAVSEAHKRASKKYNEKRDNIMIRPQKEDGARIRAEAAAAGQSVQNYILAAVDGQRETGPAIRLDADVYAMALEAASAAGEPLPEWVSRAVKDQADRDRKIQEIFGRGKP
jgi:predicted HicB family RNase H-like nuclease